MQVQDAEQHALLEEQMQTGLNVHGFEKACIAQKNFFFFFFCTVHVLPIASLKFRSMSLPVQITSNQQPAGHEPVSWACKFVLNEFGSL